MNLKKQKNKAWNVESNNKLSGNCPFNYSAISGFIMAP